MAPLVYLEVQLMSEGMSPHLVQNLLYGLAPFLPLFPLHIGAEKFITGKSQANKPQV